MKQVTKMKRLLSLEGKELVQERTHNQRTLAATHSRCGAVITADGGPVAG